MRLGAAAWGLHETPLEDQLRICQTLDLTELELSIAGGENDRLQIDATQKEIAAVRDLYKNAGIGLTCVSLSCGFNRSAEIETLNETLERVQRIIDITSTLGAQAIRVFIGGKPEVVAADDHWEAMRDCLRQAGEYAQPLAIDLAIETHGGVEFTPPGVRHVPSISTEADLLEQLLNELPDNIGINFDPANLKAVGIRDIPGFLERFLSRVKYFHCKDFQFISGTDHVNPVACGDDDLVWEPLLKMLADFSGAALIEYENTADVEDGLRRSAVFLTPLMERLGVMSSAVK